MRDTPIADLGASGRLAHLLVDSTCSSPQQIALKADKDRPPLFPLLMSDTEGHLVSSRFLPEKIVEERTSDEDKGSECFEGQQVSG